jgi:large subunit ribosomal protein L25
LKEHQMAETKSLAASVRSGTGKGAARSVRREGRIPGVIYGGGDAPTAITLSFRDVNKVIYAGHFLTTIFEIDVDGAKERVIPRDYQLDPIKDRPLHVDFLRLKAGTRLRVDIPVIITGAEEAPGLKLGGVINIVRHSLDLKVGADAIPENVTIDISGMEIGDSKHLSDVKLPAGARPAQRGLDYTIVTVAPPIEAEDEPEAAVAAPDPKAAKGAPAKGGDAKAPAGKGAPAAPAAKKK